MALFEKKRKSSTPSKSFSREDTKKILAPDSPFVIKEAYSSIRTNLLFMQKGEKCPIFVVTSPTSCEKSHGKIRWRSKATLD